MKLPTDLFLIDELEKLDEKQLAILREAILSEIRTSQEIRKILRRKLRPVYNKLASKKK